MCAYMANWLDVIKKVKALDTKHTHKCQSLTVSPKNAFNF